MQQRIVDIERSISRTTRVANFPNALAGQVHFMAVMVNCLYKRPCFPSALLIYQHAPFFRLYWCSLIPYETDWLLLRSYESQNPAPITMQNIGKKSAFPDCYSKQLCLSCYVGTYEKCSQMLLTSTRVRKASSVYMIMRVIIFVKNWSVSVCFHLNITQWYSLKR